MLFVDIAGFTTVCERVPPDVLSGLVSQYFDRASRIVMEHDGLIDKFIGDCIMAVWGAPFGVANQEVKAALTGKLLDRETMVESAGKNWDEAGELLRVRVGISSGEVLAGNMGSADRMSYTVIGDPVNLAARLESMNKQLGTRVMVSEMTAASSCAAVRPVFVLRLLMPIAVVGKDKPVKVYEVMGHPMTAVASSKSFQMLYDLCEKYLKDGCPSDFDGVFRALEK
jgi:adenylate cyclase